MTDGRDSHARALASTLRRLANAESGLWWQNYVKDSAPFLGVPMPAIRAAMLDWHSARIANVMAPARQVDLALRLFSGRHTEDKLAGTLLLAEVLLPAGAVRPARDLPRFAALFSRGLLYDWNACDWFCTKVLGPMIRDEATLGTDCGAAISSADRASRALCQDRRRLGAARGFSPRRRLCASCLGRRSAVFLRREPHQRHQVLRPHRKRTVEAAPCRCHP